VEEPERALLRYRSDPTDRNFSPVAALYRPWLLARGVSARRSFGSANVLAEVDDAVNEGLLALSRAARRYVYLCPCGRTFLERAAIRRHGRERHRVRGPVELVELPHFCEESARLAVRRTFSKSISLEPCLDDPADLDRRLGADRGVEDRLLLDLALRRAGERLRGEALVLLRRALLDEERAPPVELLLGELASRAFAPGTFLDRA